MLTVAEAIRRLDINNMAMRRYGSLQWQVYFREDRQQDKSNTYLTDDLDDAVIQASRMRRDRKAKLCVVSMRHILTSKAIAHA